MTNITIFDVHCRCNECYTETKDKDDREKSEKLHQENVDALKKSIQAVKDELQSQLAAPKKN